MIMVIVLSCVGLIILLPGIVYAFKNPREKGQDFSTNRKLFLAATSAGVVLIITAATLAIIG